MKLCLKLALILPLTFSIARSATNVARSKTAVSSSVKCAPGGFPPCFPASQAVDGNLVSLATTENGVNQYVAVDLGQAYQVIRVVFSGYPDPPYFTTCNLGVTNTDLNTIKPTPSNYRLCSTFAFGPTSPPVPSVVTASCPLNLYPRRWVVSQQIATYSFLSIAEMEVYVAQKRATSYGRSAGKRVVKDAALIGNPFTVAKRVDCMVACLKSEDCDSFNFRPSDNNCELHDWDKGVTSTDITSASDWDLWQPTYAVTEQ